MSATTGRVGLVLSLVLNVQYWLTLTGSLGSGKGTDAAAERARIGIGPASRSMKTLPEGPPSFPGRGDRFAREKLDENDVSRPADRLR